MVLKISLIACLALLNTPAYSFAPSLVGRSRQPLFSDSPSDYDPQDLPPVEKSVSVSYSDEDEAIRDALKRELLLLASVTNRGEYASSEERDLVIDIVTQLGE